LIVTRTDASFRGRRPIKVREIDGWVHAWRFASGPAVRFAGAQVVMHPHVGFDIDGVIVFDRDVQWSQRTGYFDESGVVQGAGGTSKPRVSGDAPQDQRLIGRLDERSVRRHLAGRIESLLWNSD
jgi:hypothetical protein